MNTGLRLQIELNGRTVFDASGNVLLTLLGLFPAEGLTCRMIAGNEGSSVAAQFKIVGESDYDEGDL